MNNFHKTKLIYKISTYIAEKRKIVLRDLVAYTTDPVRYSRRMRTLTQLAQYEHDLLVKIQNFETDEAADLENSIDFIKFEINSVIDSNA